MRSNLNSFKFKKSIEKLVFLPPSSNKGKGPNEDLKAFYDNYIDKKVQTKRTMKTFQGNTIGIKDQKG